MKTGSRKESATKFVKGSVVSLDLEAVKKDPLHLKPRVVFAPTATEFAQSVRHTEDLPASDHARERAGPRLQLQLRRKTGWTRKKLNVPDNLTVSM